jgi:hypothetical protein
LLLGEFVADEGVFRLFVAFVAFLLAGYIQGGGTWRGHHNLRKSLPAKGATVGMAPLPRGGAGLSI